MKRFLILLSFCLTALPLSAQQRVRERVYVSTDRDVYVAGDAVWMSAWCLNAATGHYSTLSKIAYVEIHSPQGLVHTAKIALDHGRGGGRFFLPTALPTGNYRLFAYTLLGASEEGFDALTGARTISVFNTFTTDRSPDGVGIVEHVPAAAARQTAGALSIRTAGSAGKSSTTQISVTNNGTQTARFQLGVHHADGIPAPAGLGIADFVEGVHHLPAQGRFSPEVIPEYEGEIIRARVSGLDAAGMQDIIYKYAFISSPGGGENIYSESISEDGRATFFTDNIYGEREMFLEIEGIGRENVCHLELESPFLNLDAGQIPRLEMSGDYAAALRLRSLGMQLEKNFDADTLYSDIPIRRHLVFDERDRTRYILDDYTRFPVMEEVFIEFIPELRVRRVDGKRELQVRVVDLLGNYSFPQGAALVLLDGIPVLDHEKIIGYDPLLVDHIDIYQGSYFLGVRNFNGVVNFVTYKGTLPSMQFEDNVRIVDFQGCALPLAYTCTGVGSDYPDYRQTIWWHPLLTLEPGETLTLECKTPAYGGRFEAVAEGLDDGGGAVSAYATLDVR